MTLPRVYALFAYWEQNPPAAEAMRLAWLRVEETIGGKGAGADDDNGAVGSFMGLPGVDGSKWVGPPPMKVADVIRMAEMASKKDKANG